MRIWLDDERDPKDPSIQKDFKASGDEIWVKTATDAIELLKTNQVISISLDHDLGVGNGTGYDVAQFIEEQSFHGKIPKLDWFVHSMNIVGSRNIVAALLKANAYWNSTG